MKQVFRIASALLVSVFAVYHLYFFVLPSVTISNRSGDAIELARVTLPSSGLDFGPLEPASENTIHYSLEQSDGVYEISIAFADGAVIESECGAVAANEIHKRQLISIYSSAIVCE